MKKVFCVLAAVAFVASITTSCKKDCTCTFSDGTTAVVYPDIKKSDCDTFSDTFKLAGGKCEQ